MPFPRSTYFPKLGCLLGGLALAGAALAQQAPSLAAADADDAADAADAASAYKAGAARTTYRITNLGAGGLVGDAAINASGQVAFGVETERNGPLEAWFYDGARLQNIGHLGAPFAYPRGLNDAGQIVGTSLDAADNVRAFVWSRRRGMIDVGTLPGRTDSWEPAMNAAGVVSGYSTGTPLPYAHALRWTLSGGIEDLGAFTTGPDSISQANAINDAGLIAGTSVTAANRYHAFAWTRATGMVDIDTMDNSYSAPVAVSARGQVAGNYFVNGGTGRAFVWTRAGGMRDIGAAGRDEAWVVSMSASGQLAGVISDSGGYQQAMTWTRAGGMIDLGTFGGGVSTALAANNKGQVVGGAATPAGVYHAFAWSAREGMVDLNTRLRHAPAGLVLEAASAVSDSGAIVASSNAGLVLLTPGHGHRGGHTVGPITAAALVRVGAPFDAAVSFAADDPASRYHVAWSWGDGSGERAGNTSHGSDGGAASGKASGNYAYKAPGIYTVTARVVDLAGNSIAVSRKIVAYDAAAGLAAGSGSFISQHFISTPLVSPQLPGKPAAAQGGVASFSFVAPLAAKARAAGAQGQLSFRVGGLNFHSKELRAVAQQGIGATFAGSGAINGAGNYQFSMAATAGNNAAARFGLKIWHLDPVSKEEVVDYDNQGQGAARKGRGDGFAGVAITEGVIAL